MTLRGAIGATPGIALRGAPDATVFAFGGTDGPGLARRAFEVLLSLLVLPLWRQWWVCG